MFLKLFKRCWISPVQAQTKLRQNGFVGPATSFPLGNFSDIKKLNIALVMAEKRKSSTIINHDIHSIALPHFALWQQQYGKVFVYWLGIEPFVYVADPEFLSVMSKGVLAKSWGKPNVLKKDREPMFGNGLVMVEGDDWTRHRHMITPAFPPLNLKAYHLAAFWISRKPKELGKEIDSLLLSIINERKRSLVEGDDHHDLLGSLLKAEKGEFTASEIVDECKTFFFAGVETTALALTWTFMLLAIHPEWQDTLRDEIRQVIGDSEIEYKKLAGLKKMSWVMNEVLRLYPSAPNAQRQARRDIEVNGRVIPNGTNIWIDVVAMHHDVELWGDDVNEFKPERFDGDLHGGCKNKMGFMPFGFGGRMCIGRNMGFMEYKIPFSLVLSRFEISFSPRLSPFNKACVFP
uniref:Cytochrome P450 n=1 Tax=Brassica oleracea var. oleracea TaxID=109376 RepID=A0A0D3AMS2_BRAOL